MQDEVCKGRAGRRGAVRRAAQFLKIAGGTGAAGALAIFLAACGDDDEEQLELELG